MTAEAARELEGVSAERAGLLVDALLLLIVLRCLRGVSDASCRSVDTRCIRGGSGEIARNEFTDDACEATLRGTMKPYRSTSPPLRSSQSSIPPASSVSSRTTALFLLLLAVPECDGTRSDATPLTWLPGAPLDCEAVLDPL